MNEFLKNLNVVQAVKMMVSLVEKRKYKIESLIYFEKALSSFEENEILKELEQEMELPVDMNCSSMSNRK